MPDHILCGTDFSVGAEMAFARARSIAKRSGCAIRLVHAPEDGDPEAFADDARLAQAVDGQGRGIAVDAEIVRGRPAEVLAELGRAAGCRLVMVGPSNRRSVKGRFLGGTAERLIRSCATPVLAVRRPLDRPYRRALAGLDFETASREAVDAALALPLIDKEELAFAHALPPSLDHVMADVPLRRSREVEQATGNEALAAAKAVARAVGVDPTRARVFLEAGEPHQVLAGAAARWNADLLLLGTHGRGPVAALFVGSTAAALLRRSPCDVLVKRNA